MTLLFPRVKKIAKALAAPTNGGTLPQKQVERLRKKNKN